jgi:hypothetical protein
VEIFYGSHRAAGKLIGISMCLFVEPVQLSHYSDSSDDAGLISCVGRHLLFASSPDPVSCPTGIEAVKRPGLEADHSHTIPRLICGAIGLPQPLKKNTELLLT